MLEKVRGAVTYLKNMMPTRKSSAKKSGNEEFFKKYLNDDAGKAAEKTDVRKLIDDACNEGRAAPVDKVEIKKVSDKN